MALHSFLVVPGIGHLPFACAVTALDEEDAVALVRETYLAQSGSSASFSVEEMAPVDIQRRIGPANYGLPVTRGIWYPHLDTP